MEGTEAREAQEAPRNRRAGDKKYMIPDKLYQVLKWTAAPALPALAVLYAAIAPEWGLPYVQPMVVTMTALSAFIGALLGVSKATARTVTDDEAKG